MSKVRIPPMLREEVGGAREVPAAGENVRELLDDLMGQFPALRAQLVRDDEIAPFVNVYLEGEDVRTLDGLDTRVEPGQTVILLPAMAGGCHAPLAGGGSRRAESGSAARLTPLTAGRGARDAWPYRSYCPTRHSLAPLASDVPATRGT